MPVENHTVSKQENGIRLDRWFTTHFPDVPFSAIQRACRKGEVRLDSARVKGKERIAEGQNIRVPPFARKPKEKPGLTDNETSQIRKMVIYEDNHIFVLNKPAGLATQGGTKTHDHIDRLLDGLPKIDEEKPRLVHRLDKETSGVLLIARTREAATRLGKMFMSRYMKKYYLAVTIGVPDPHEGTIDAALIKKRIGGQDRVVHDAEEGQMAITDFKVADYAHRSTALVALFPRTGRQHQLRAHLSLVETPILGDDKYADDKELYGIDIPDNLYLHAYGLVFNHPFERGRTIKVSAPLPQHFTQVVKQLGLGVPRFSDVQEYFAD